VQKIGQNPKINLETNFFLISEMGFLGTFKVKKKNPSQTSLITWNHLEQKASILVVRNEEIIFFSL
jgi:hypothetical protein